MSIIEIRSAGYGIVPKLVMLDRSISISAKGLYAYLSSYAGKDNECYPTRSKICYDLKICSSVVSRCIKELTDAGYIRKIQVRKSGKFTNNLYRLTQTVESPVLGDSAGSLHHSAVGEDFAVCGNTAAGKAVNGVMNNTITNNINTNNKNINNKINNSTKESAVFRFLEPDEDFFSSIMQEM